MHSLLFIGVGQIHHLWFRLWPNSPVSLAEFTKLSQHYTFFSVNMSVGKVTLEVKSYLCCRVPILESNVMSGPRKIRSRGSWSHIVSKATDA